ncbi:hypothetical protein [Nannocystis sp. SCPEA4]|uniref:hypothetical protein n=1 Tax=Nannocystis sp. SCPEA4 TaxID=2996787 RepID=UPI0022719FB6|nr:hypothetical protein [Nannocystis sp. SCPEA4]MCY1058891.1 hypothetical protein [Nannocystis sp. SCPEA4]
MRRPLAFAGAATWLFVAGCGGTPMPGDVGADSASSTGHDTSGTLPSTGGTTSDEDTEESTDGGSTGAAETDATTGGSAELIADGCEAYCENLVSCGWGEPQLGECVQQCLVDYESEGACAAGNVALLACLAGMTCDEIATDTWASCAEAAKAQGEACGVLHCNVFGSGESGSSVCTIELECAAEPPQRMECDTELCVCFEDGVQVASCEPSASICTPPEEDAEVDPIVAWTRACCGF